MAIQLVSQYPDSFADRTYEGEIPGCGHYSLLMQIQNRLEHMNRNNSAAHLRKVRRQIIERTPDIYGCQLAASITPEGESVESFQRQRN